MLGQLNELSSSDFSLVTIKKARKQIEQDAQILANRIALLKQEELKSWKKIDETKKKAREVYHLKKKHEEKQEEKKQRAKQEQMRTLYSGELRKQTQQEREQIREVIQNQKRQEFDEIKRLKEMNGQKRLKILKKQQDEKLRRHDIIKLQEELGSVKKKEYIESKKNGIKSLIDLKKKEEASIKNQREMEVLNMERLEIELIKKLQQTQALQKAAFEELEVALAEKPDDYERRFLPRKSSKNAGMSREASGHFTPMSVKNSDLQQLRSSEQNAFYNSSGYYQSKQGIRGQPDSKVEEIQFLTSQQKILLMPDMENAKNTFNVELVHVTQDSGHQDPAPQNEIVEKTENQQIGANNESSEQPKKADTTNLQETKTEGIQENTNVKEQV